jgi:hypothetical protein
MNEPEQYVYFSELVILILQLATPVLAVFWLAALAYFRKAGQKTWFRALGLSVATTAIAFAVTFALWVALGVIPWDLPEPLFMIGGVINCVALVACVVVGVIVVMWRRKRLAVGPAV